MKPPRAAELVLLAIAGAAVGEFVAGDLAEEFAFLAAHRGHRAARRWYTRQVARSLATLVALRMRSGELTEVVLRAVLGVLLPLVALDQLWRFVYSQIPLKDSVERAPGLLAANVAVMALCSWAAGGRARDSRNGAGADALAALGAAALAVWAAVGAAPAIYVACLLAAAPAHSLWTMWRRRLR